MGVAEKLCWFRLAPVKRAVGQNMEKYRICKKCAIHHFENCGSCFGFGVYSVPDRPGEVFPVTAGEAIETKAFRGEVKACPECGSTVMGLPNNACIGQVAGAGKADGESTLSATCQ